MTPQELETRLAGLTRRSAKYWRVAKWMMLPIFLTAALAGILGIIAAFGGPSDQITNIDIPAKLSALFVSEVDNMPTFESMFGELEKFMFQAIPIVILTAIILSMGVVIVVGFAGSRVSILPVVGFLFIAFIAPVYIIYMSDNDGGIQDGTFESELSHMEFYSLLNRFSNAGISQLPEAVYVLAQVAVASDMMEKESVHDYIVNNNHTLLLPLEANGQQLYAVEQHVFGETRSTAASDYYNSELSKQRHYVNVASFIAWLSAALIMVVIPIAYAARVLSKRVHRLNTLMISSQSDNTSCQGL